MQKTLYPLLNISKVVLTKPNHQTQYKQQFLFENTFAESGHWDFILLYTLDWFVRLVIVHTLSPISEWFFIEKAGLRLNQMLSYVKLRLAGWNLLGLNSLSISLFYGLSYSVLLYGFSNLVIFL